VLKKCVVNGILSVVLVLGAVTAVSVCRFWRSEDQQELFGFGVTDGVDEETCCLIA